MSGHRSHADASGSRARGSGAHRAAAQQPTGASAGDEAAPLPAWAVEIEEQLLKTARWQALLARMADEVQDKLAHNGVAVCGVGPRGLARSARRADRRRAWRPWPQFFSDLGEDEQAAIIDQVRVAESLCMPCEPRGGVVTALMALARLSTRSSGLLRSPSSATRWPMWWTSSWRRSRRRTS